VSGDVIVETIADGILRCEGLLRVLASDDYARNSPPSPSGGLPNSSHEGDRVSTPEPKDAETPCGPLHGIRVIDVSRVLAGPFCGSLLADLGADVIRVEHPTKHDEVRSWAPARNGISAAFAAVNHSKRGIVVDLSQADGLQVFRRLLATADVMIENFRPGTLERLGLDSAALRDVNPRLIHCAIRAFPAGTAAEGLPGYEASVQAYSGS
jgi:crotonobetainyl-CoA:carnitine CoA-transferase CaiB-like acyl-CoA transferase